MGQEKWDAESKESTFSLHDLMPGQSVTFIIPVRPGAPPKQVGVICKIPELGSKSKFRSTLEYWWARIKIAMKIKPRHEPRDRIWCRDVLMVTESEPANRGASHSTL